MGWIASSGGVGGSGGSGGVVVVCVCAQCLIDRIGAYISVLESIILELFVQVHDEAGVRQLLVGACVSAFVFPPLRPIMMSK